jgi:hypothetical protein
MKMIVHQAEGVDLPIGLGAGLAEGFEKALPVGLIPEDGFAPVPAIQHMVDGPFILDPPLAWQAKTLPLYFTSGPIHSGGSAEMRPRVLSMLLWS